MRRRPTPKQQRAQRGYQLWTQGYLGPVVDDLPTRRNWFLPDYDTAGRMSSRNRKLTHHRVNGTPTRNMKPNKGDH